MALDSYRIKEVKEVKEEKSLQQSIAELRKSIDSLPTMDIDQKWVKENEIRENIYSTSTQKNEDEQIIDDVLEKFKRTREINNNTRAKMRNQQLSSFNQKLQETQQCVDSMQGGKSK